MQSQFNFLKDYSILNSYYKHFERAEEYLYDSPQDTCSQIHVFLESFVKQLCKEKRIPIGPKDRVSRAIDELYNSSVFDAELKNYAFCIVNNRNASLHNDEDNIEKAIDSLKNGFAFCKRYIRTYLDPTITTGFYRIPSQIEIRNRKIENLGTTDTISLIQQLKKAEALCLSKDEEIWKQSEIVNNLKKQLDEKDRRFQEAALRAEHKSKKQDALFSEAQKELKKIQNDISEKEIVLSRQKEQIDKLDSIVNDLKNKEEKRKQRIETILSDDSTYLEGLNFEQRQAVLETEGFVRVLAGPGTGKTKTLVHRFVHLVISKHVEPDNILCLTFTNKASREMKSRIGEWLGACDLSQVCTFHSFCYRIVTENADLLHFSDSFVLLDTDDKNSLIEEICERIGIDTSEKGYSVSKIRRYIDGFKSGISRRRYLDLLFGPSDEAVDCAIKSSSTQLDEICYRFLYEQRTSALLEFDDLIHAVSYLFYTNPQVMSWWQNRIKYVMVDEYQDVNGFQAQMCKCLSAVNKNLFVVGDPNQTIYSWRFADVKYINQFVAESKEKDIVLVDNYRSTPEILSVARNLIRKQSKYSFVARNPSGERPVFYQAKTRSEEAAWIVNTMNWIVRQGVPRNEVAVLYRNSSSSSRIEYELLKRKLPYIVIGGNSFYSSNDIKVIIAYLQLIVYDNDFAFKKVIGKPSRGIGGKTLAKLFCIQVERNCSLFEALSISLSESIPNVFSTSTSVKKARDFVAFVETIRKELETSSISKIVSDIIELSGYVSFLSENDDDDGLRNIIEFLSTVQNIESENAKAGITNYSVQDYLKETATYTSSDNSEKTNSFVLSTVHGAKGLEYQYVILSGMEESSFPSDFKYRNGTITTEIEHIQEERRLCFVALTRATKGVFVTNASTVNNDGPNDRLIPSRFINEMQK